MQTSGYFEFVAKSPSEEEEATPAGVSAAP
jgi:hypothetical protein